MEQDRIEDQRREDARRIIKRFMLYNSGMGLVPVPGLELITLPGLQVRMIQKLARLYDLEFSENIGKSVIAVLLSFGAKTSTTGILRHVLKVVPVVGQAAGLMASSVLDGATTYAVGMVFVQHFETGGTLLDFDPASMKEHYTRHLVDGVKQKAPISYAGVKP